MYSSAYTRNCATVFTVGGMGEGTCPPKISLASLGGGHVPPSPQNIFTGYIIIFKVYLKKISK